MELAAAVTVRLFPGSGVRSHSEPPSVTSPLDSGKGPGLFHFSDVSRDKSRGERTCTHSQSVPLGLHILCLDSALKNNLHGGFYE